MKKTYIRRKSASFRKTNSAKSGFISPKPAPHDQHQGELAAAPASEASVSHVVQTAGFALPETDKAFFGKRLGHNFSDVRIHTGPEADASTNNLHAKAYSVGNHIVFKDGQYNPATQAGKALLAHELTHVVQQQHGVQAIQRAPEGKEITAPLPKVAVVEEKTGNASFTAANTSFVVEPDEVVEKPVTWRNQTIAPEANGAITSFAISYSNSYEMTGDKYTKVTTTYTVYIKTFYNKGVDKSATSKYGRGTTEDDKKAGNTSLRFHESMHGQDIQDYVAKNPLPKVDLALPATKAAYDEAIKAHATAVAEYSAALQAYTEQTTDEVGTPKTPPAEPDAQTNE
jgi:hypothetical protein